MNLEILGTWGDFKVYMGGDLGLLEEDDVVYLSLATFGPINKWDHIFSPQEVDFWQSELF